MALNPVPIPRDNLIALKNSLVEDLNNFIAYENYISGTSMVQFYAAWSSLLGTINAIQNLLNATQ